MSAVEAVIQRRIIAYLRGLDRTYVLNVGGGASTPRGTPDLIVCHDGRFYGLEVKRPDTRHRLTDAQASRLRAIERAGGIGAVVTSVEEVATLLETKGASG